VYTFAPGERTGVIYRAVEAPDGGVIILTEASARAPLLLKLDRNWQVVWSRRVTGFARDATMYGDNLFVRSTGGILLGFVASVPSPPQTTNVWRSMALDLSPGGTVSWLHAYRQLSFDGSFYGALMPRGDVASGGVLLSTSYTGTWFGLVLDSGGATLAALLSRASTKRAPLALLTGVRGCRHSPSQDNSAGRVASRAARRERTRSWAMAYQRGRRRQGMRRRRRRAPPWRRVGRA